MHGLEPQTIESLNLLKARKTPFIVALNKIDRLYDWQSAQRKDVKDIIKSQHTNTQNEFETRTKEVILQFAEQVNIVYIHISVYVICKSIRFQIHNQMSLNSCSVILLTLDWSYY